MESAHDRPRFKAGESAGPNEAALVVINSRRRRSVASRFAAFIAIDWSGAVGPRQKGIAVAKCETGDDAPAIVRPDHIWSRADVLSFLRHHADARTDILIGVDLSPALPHADFGAYFPGWAASPPDAKQLWSLVDTWSDQDPHLGVLGFLRHSEARRHFRHQRDTGDLFSGTTGRLRVCEVAQKAMQLSPSSCFNLIGPAQVGKSSLTGMRVLNRLAGAIPIWPFDPVPTSGPMIVEIYTTIAARTAGLRKGLSKIRSWEALDAALIALASQPTNRTGPISDHASDAILTAAWMRIAADTDNFWHPSGLTDEIARTEGWTFGVV